MKLKTNSKRIISVVLSVIMVLAVMQATFISSYATDVSGSCGDSVTWSFNTDTGALTISGTGNMSDFASAKNMPWYAYCDAITSITIESGVERIGNFAFRGCSSLREISIANTVLEIGKQTFHGCSALQAITLPTNLNLIDDYAFRACTELTTISIPSGVKSISNYSFDGCTKLTSVTLSPNTQTVGNNAFSDCTSLSDINLPEGIKSIGDEAFSGCTSLTSITIPSTVILLGGASFANCENLSSFIYNATNCEDLSDSVFGSDGTPAESFSITIGENVEKIPACIFALSAIQSIVIPDRVLQINDNAFFGCGMLSSVKLSKRLDSIGSYAFAQCTSLTDIQLPLGLSTIHADAFSGTAITELTIPKYVSQIDVGEYETITSIKGYGGSAAQAYATEKSFEFTALDTDHVVGDMNDDGQFSLLDYAVCKQAAVGLIDVDYYDHYKFDLNNDSAIDAFDAFEAEKALSGFTTLS